jgi:uncharacterized protein DUF5941
VTTAAATAPLPAVPARPDPIPVYRDDGPLARALGVLGRAVPVPAPLLQVAALVPLLAMAAFAGSDVADGAVAGLIACVIVLAGASSGSPPREKIRWAEPPLMRAIEYSALIWIAAVSGADAYPAAFALLAALTFRHYDLVYRLRHRGVVPARWVSVLGLGWDGRLILAVVLLVAGALPAGYFVVAAILGVAFVAEAVYGWLAVGLVQRPLEYEDEEDEGQ